MAEAVTTPEPGIHPDVPFAEYLAWPLAHAGLLRAMEHAPAMARHRMDKPEADRPAYLKGRLFHLLSCQPQLANSEFVCRPETYSPKEGVVKPWHGGAQVCKDWVKEHEAKGLTAVAPDVYEEAYGMAESVRRHPKLGPLVDRAQIEVSVVWDDPMTGVRCKGRWDLWKGGILADLKSTSGSADPKKPMWASTAIRYGYHIQLAMYVDALKILAEPKDVPWYCLGVVESYAPFLCCDYNIRDDPDCLSFEVLEYGRARYRSLLDQFRACQKSGEWPGYETQNDLMLPGWVRDQEAYGL